MAGQGMHSARANRRLEDTADEFLKLERNQDTNLGCIRTEIEELMGAETTGYREELKDVKKFRDKAACTPDWIVERGGHTGRLWTRTWRSSPCRACGASSYGPHCPGTCSRPV